MTEQEQFSVNIQRQIDAQNARIDSVMAKVDMLVVESQQQREDIRRAQEKHDADMKEIRERQEAAQAKHDAQMHEMNERFYAKTDAMNAKIDAKFDKLGEQIHTMTITAVVGFGAIIVAVGGLIVAVLK